MLKLNISGTLGKFGYTDVPDEIIDMILKATIDKAYLVAVQNAPYDPDHPIHIKEEIKKEYFKDLRIGAVWVESPYANITEYGSKNRLMHPFIRPAAKAGRALMKAIARGAIKKAVEDGKDKAGI